MELIDEGIDRGRFVMIGQGENKRSMVYVKNVVDSALAVVNNEKVDGKIYLVTDGIDYTIKELYEIIARRLGKRPLPFHVPMVIARGLGWVGDIGGSITWKDLPFNSEVLNKLTSSLTISSRKIQEEVGFKPKYNLYNAIDETIEWYRGCK